MAAGSAGDIILVHTIAAYADCADENTVSIQTKGARKNRDPVRESWVDVRRSGIEPDASRIAMITQETGETLLLPVERAL